MKCATEERDGCRVRDNARESANEKENESEVHCVHTEDGKHEDYEFSLGELVCI